MYSSFEKKIIAASAAAAILASASIPSGAMHIAEGYLQPAWVVAWGVLSFPVLTASFIAIRKKSASSAGWVTMLLLSMAFALVMSSLKIPSVTGSSSHLTGVGFGTMLLGPAVMTAVSFVVLFYQALFAAHGGLTTIGANVFAMGIVGPLVTFLIFKGVRKLGGHQGFAVFSAVLIGNIASYAMTAFQLALAHPSNGIVTTSFQEFFNIFAVTQISLGIVEGLLSVAALNLVKYLNLGEVKAFGSYNALMD